jgi:hypothetical protein
LRDITAAADVTGNLRARPSLTTLRQRRSFEALVLQSAYTSNHELLASKDIGASKRFGLHAIDAVGLVHALLLRIQPLILPIRELVLGGR